MSWQDWGPRGRAHHELNYLVSEKTALRVREFVQCHLDFDEYSVGCPNYSYPIHSLYLDSDDLTLYRRALNDIEHRWQLRVRYSAVHPDAQTHFEIKHRYADIVTRQKCAVRQETVPFVLAGQLLDAKHLASRNPRDLVALQRFVELSGAIRAKPKLHVAYLREAYVSDDGSVRVTMDREIRCQASLIPDLTVEMGSPSRLFQPFVLLELNFAERFPDWFRDLVETFSLKECEADKFLEGMSALGHRAFRPAARASEFPRATGI